MTSEEIKKRILNLNTEQGKISSPQLNNYLNQLEEAIRYEQQNACFAGWKKMFNDAVSELDSKRAQMAIFSQ
jgi:hypothetical protein